MTKPRKPDDEIEALLTAIEGDAYLAGIGESKPPDACAAIQSTVLQLRSAIAALRRERDDIAESYNLECEARKRWRNLADKLAGECATSIERAEATSRRLRARIASKLADADSDTVLSRSEVLGLVDDCCAAICEGAKDE